MHVAPSNTKSTTLCNKVSVPGVFCLKIAKKKKKSVRGNLNQKETNGF